MGQVKQSGICPNSDNVTLSDIEQFTTVPRRTSLWSGLRRILYLRSPLPISSLPLADALGRKRQRDGFGGLALLPQCGREPWPTLNKPPSATVFSPPSRPKISGCSSRTLSPFP